MAIETIEAQVIVVKAADEHVTHDSQQELWAYVRALEATDIKVTPRYLFQDSAEAAVSILNEFKVMLPMITPLAGIVIGSWITARAGRKVRIKVGEDEVEATSVEEVERLLDMLKERSK